MFDVALRNIVDPLLRHAASVLARVGVSANGITLTGAIIGVGAGWAVASQDYGLSLLLVILNRVLDGLDGLVARISGASAWGGYLDSVADYIFYVAIPIGFGIAEPANLLPALMLTASFVLTSVSFLAFAAIAAQSGSQNGPEQQKAFFYAPGIIEGGETIAFFVAMCLFPNWFAALASILAGLCLLTVAHRVWLAHRTFV